MLLRENLVALNLHLSLSSQEKGLFIVVCASTRNSIKPQLPRKKGYLYFVCVSTRNMGMTQFFRPRRDLESRVFEYFRSPLDRQTELVARTRSPLNELANQNASKHIGYFPE